MPKAIVHLDLRRLTTYSARDVLDFFVESTFLTDSRAAWR
jgi:hypothetical protein